MKPFSTLVCSEDCLLTLSNKQEGQVNYSFRHDPSHPNTVENITPQGTGNLTLGKKIIHKLLLHGQHPLTTITWLSMVRNAPRVVVQAKNVGPYSAKYFSKERVAIMRCKNIIERPNGKHPSLGRVPTKLVFTSRPRS
jgi:hypothetical protein